MSQVTLLGTGTRSDAIGIFEDERGHAGARKALLWQKRYR